MTDWLIPDRFFRTVVYSAYTRILFERALCGGWIDSTGDQLGAAVWHSYPEPFDTPRGGDWAPDVVAALADAVPDERVWTMRDAASRFQTLDELVAGCEPDEPHERLALVGVHPALQRRGIGTRLLSRERLGGGHDDHRSGRPGRPGTADLLPSDAKPGSLQSSRPLLSMANNGEGTNIRQIE